MLESPRRQPAQQLLQDDVDSSVPLSLIPTPNICGMKAKVLDEIKSHFSIAWPVCLTFLLRKSSDLISIIFVGHLSGSLLGSGLSSSHYVACVGLASVTANVTGNSMVIGLAGALSTICSQAYGAKDTLTFSTTLQKALLILFVCICIPISLLWYFSEGILVSLGQQAPIARDTAQYLRCLIPNLWALTCSFCLANWLYAQSITKPSAVVQIITAALHPLWCYLFIYTFRMGYLGAAFAVTATKFTELILLVVYVTQFSTILIDTQFKVQWPWSTITDGRENVYDIRGSWWPFLRLGIPNLMMMTEWWASEIIIFMSGTLSRDPKITECNVSAMSIYQLILSICFMIPSGFHVSGSTRVGNSLGDNNPSEAKLAAYVAPSCAAILSSIIAVIITVFRNEGMRLFTSDPRVLSILSTILLILLAYVVADGVQTAFTGVLKGLGKQRVGGPIVVFSYYAIGIPVSAALAFHWGLKLGVIGLCVGTTIGTWVHMLLYGVVIARTNWSKEAEAIHKKIILSGVVSNASSSSGSPNVKNALHRFSQIGNGDVDDFDEFGVDINSWLDELTVAGSDSSQSSHLHERKAMNHMTFQDWKVSGYNFLANRFGWKRMLSEYELVYSCTDALGKEGASIDDVIL